MLRPAVITIVTVAVSLLLLISNMNQRQKKWFEDAEAAYRAGNFMVALTGYETTIRMYLPFSERVEGAAGQIWKMGQEAERVENRDQALAAYRSLRSAFYALRWLRQPGADWIAKADKKIAELAPLRRGEQP